MMPASEQTTDPASGLRSCCLSFGGVLAGSLGIMGISASIVVMIPLVFASAGNGTWLAFAAATSIYILVAIQVNIFARRIATPGSICTFIHSSLGPGIGLIAGWLLAFGYISLLPAYLAGVSYYLLVFVHALSGPSGTEIIPEATQIAVTGCIIAILGWWISIRNIEFSTKIILVIELVTLSMISIVIVNHAFRTGVSLDFSQLDVKNADALPFGSGLVLAMSCFLGFEACCVLGIEARLPLKMIPRANMLTVIMTGAAITTASYVLVQAFHKFDLEITRDQDVFWTFVNVLDLGPVAPFILAGVVFSGFGCILGILNTGPRLLYSLACQGAFHSVGSRLHSRYRTPYVGSTLVCLTGLAVTQGLLINRTTVMEIISYSMTFGSFGFVASYIICAFGAAVYLYKTRQDGFRLIYILPSILTILILLVSLSASINSILSMR